MYWIRYRLDIKYLSWVSGDDTLGVWTGNRILIGCRSVSFFIYRNLVMITGILTQIFPKWCQLWLDNSISAISRELQMFLSSSNMVDSLTTQHVKHMCNWLVFGLLLLWLVLCIWKPVLTPFQHTTSMTLPLMRPVIGGRITSWSRSSNTSTIILSGS